MVTFKQPWLIFSLSFLLGVFMSSEAFSANKNGLWKRPKTGAHIKSFSCGGGLGLKIVKAKKAVGTTIMCGAKPSGTNRWKGSLLSTEDGKTYTGYATISQKSLKLEGCVFGGIICKTEIWPRLK